MTNIYDGTAKELFIEVLDLNCTTQLNYIIHKTPKPIYRIMKGGSLLRMSSREIINKLKIHSVTSL